MAIDTSVVNIDFDVSKTNNCKVLRVVDESNWASTLPDAAYIDILTPGQVVPVTNVFQKNKVNVFNSNNLVLSDVTDYSFLGSIPDGIYTLTVKACPFDEFSVTKYHLQDCQIRCQIARKLISIDLNCEPCRKDLISEIQDITLYLDAAQAQADKCNINKAMEYYRRASLLLSRISDNSGCTNC